MTAVLLKMPDDMLSRSARHAEALRLSRAEYMRRAIDRMNRAMDAQRRAKRLGDASRKVRADSRRINAEFAAIESDPEA